MREIVLPKESIKALREVDRVEEFPQIPLVRKLIQQDSLVVAHNPVFLRGERGRNIRFFLLNNSRRLRYLPLMVKKRKETKPKHGYLD